MVGTSIQEGKHYVLCLVFLSSSGIMFLQPGIQLLNCYDISHLLY